ncbi:MAG: leucyl aminopeptidase family protein [Bergeyella sp.]
MKPQLSNTNKKTYSQILSFFTEENWKKNKKNFHKNTENFFSGKKGETFVITTEKSVQYLIGLGENIQNFEIQKTANDFSQKNKKNLQPVPTKIEAENFSESHLESLVKGLFLGTYQYPFKPEHPFWNEKFELHIENSTAEKLTEISQKTLALCNGQFSAMDWLNKPANFKKTNDVSAFLKDISQKYKFKYTAFNRKECEKLGLGAFVSVNQGSSMDCAFTILEYKSSVKNAKTVGLVGKCVLFDTGGISLKNSDNMHYMKSDMGGATAVIGTLIAAAEQKLPVNIVAILPITDNAISEKAYLPSDVITAYNGKTIEVLNTDAEGRMTLADGLSYLSKNYKTDVLIDLATLTGSAVRMFGDTCGAMFSNNENLKNSLIKSADETNQRLWNLPLWGIWKNDINSDVADFKNISMKPIGDCIVAAKFLEQFIENHPNWAHLDIAGVAFGNVNYAKEKAATGYGVQLLLNFLKNIG